MGQAASVPRHDQAAARQKRRSRLDQHLGGWRHSTAGIRARSTSTISASSNRSGGRVDSSASSAQTQDSPYLDTPATSSPSSDTVRDANDMTCGKSDSRPRSKASWLRGSARDLLQRAKKAMPKPTSHDADQRAEPGLTPVQIGTVQRASIASRFNSLRRARPPTSTRSITVSQISAPRRLRRTRPFSMQITTRDRTALSLRNRNSLRLDSLLPSAAPSRSIADRPPTPHVLRPFGPRQHPTRLTPSTSAASDLSDQPMDDLPRAPRLYLTRSDPNLRASGFNRPSGSPGSTTPTSLTPASNEHSFPEDNQESRTETFRERVNRIRLSGDNANILNMLLSMAATATAESLVASTDGRPRDSENVADTIDESFDDFLGALRSGRLATALRQESMGTDGAIVPLNYFRMFRFENLTAPSTNTSQFTLSSEESPEAGPNRLVPVIIVGIRSVSPRETTSGTDGGSFSDVFANLQIHPRALPTSIFRRGESRRNESRRGSGSGSTTAEQYESQRHARAPQPVPPGHGGLSQLFADDDGLQAPPATPADRMSTDEPVTPFARTNAALAAAAEIRQRRTSGLAVNSRRSGSVPRVRPASDSDPLRRVHGAGSTRRNGVVGGPSQPPDHRSYIVYVLGGQYPPTHPLLMTPSLFTDNPTYEDMMMISSLIGPAKPPVATAADVESAGGIYRVYGTPDKFVLTDETSGEIVELPLEERCLVCLGDYMIEEEVRMLRKCSHVFHRECIDQWLKTGRNSCPLCRGQGVHEKEIAAEESSTPAVV